MVLLPNNPFPQDAANCGIAFAAAKMSPEHIVASLQLSKYGEVWTDTDEVVGCWMLTWGKFLKDANLGLRKSLFLFFLNNEAFPFLLAFLVAKICLVLCWQVQQRKAESEGFYSVGTTRKSKFQGQLKL